MINETLIEKYFSKSLTPNETLEFNTRYENDFNFKQDVDFLKNVKSVSEAEDNFQFKNQLAKHEATYSDSSDSKPIKWLKPLIAVAALLFITLGVNFFMDTTIDEATLFASYFEPSKNVTAPIVRSSNDATTLNNAYIAYSDADYEHAILLFQTAFQDTKKSELLFYEANAYLALGDTENAITNFKAHLEHSDILAKRSHWYLALAYIKTSQIDKAKKELKSLLNSGEKFKNSEAKSLLDKLK